MLKFSIVTVCLNPGEALKYTLESIEKQTYKDFEVIIKDGGSTDGSLNAIPVDERFVLHNDPDKSIYDAMNIAIEKTSGDFLIFMNCGDRFHSDDVLERVAGEIERHGKSDKPLLVYGDMFSLMSENVVKAPSDITEKVCFNGIPCHQAMFYQKACFDKKNFDIKYKIRADYDHFLYLFFNDEAEFAYMDMPICDYEGGGFSESRKNKKRNKEEHNEIVEKYISKGHLIKYRARLILTFQPLREKMAKSKSLGPAYEKLRRLTK